MTDREIAERIVSLPLWSELFKAEARALIHAIEAALAAKGVDGARQMRERAATIAAGNVVRDRYVTWPCWNPGGNVGIDHPTAVLGGAIAEAITKLPLTESTE